MKEGKSMFTPLPEDRVEAYSPAGPCPPKHLARPAYVPPPREDHSQLGKYQKAKASDSITVKRCHECGAKWLEPAETSTCTCPKK